MKPSTFAPAYVAFYPMLTDIARRHGYALSIHGSVERDMDLLATPWTDEAVPAEQLMQAIASYADTCMSAMFGSAVTVLGPDEKPHGRRAWLIKVGNGSCIDLSVMPRAPRATGGES